MRAMVSLLVGLALALFSAAGAMAASGAGDRVALVIGNSKYRYANPLPNPANDARLIASTLREAGFDVVEGLDLDRAGMDESINRFTELAYDADIALIYYAGHGIQVDGSNYLIPVDAELSSPAHLKTRTTHIDDLVAALPADPAVGIIILDACRDNPLSKTLMAGLPSTRSLAMGAGLAPVQTVDAGMGSGGILIAYATDPGAVAADGKGENSPYSKALAAHLTTPDLELQSALTRVRGDVTAATLGRQRPWHNASLGREVFLGRKSPEAVKPAPQAPQIETQAEISAVERVLWDEASKRDTSDFYKAYLEQYPEGRFARIASLNIERLAMPSAVVALTPVEPPRAARSASADPVLILGAPALAKAEPVPEMPKLVETTALDEAALRLDRAAREDLQLRLVALGMDPGRIDGDIGRASRSAIAKWQGAQGLAATSFLSASQYAALLAVTDPLMPELRLRQEASLQPALEPVEPAIIPPADGPVVEPPVIRKQIIRKKTNVAKPPEKQRPKAQTQKPRKQRTQVATSGDARKAQPRRQVAAKPASPAKPTARKKTFKVIGRDDIFGTPVMMGND